jgi:chaperonin GroES
VQAHSEVLGKARLVIDTAMCAKNNRKVSPSGREHHAGLLLPPLHKRNIQMEIRPLHDRVLIRRVEETENRIGSIVIPDSAKEKPQQGEVVAVGSGKLLDNGSRVAPDVKTGDKILFGKYSGSDIKIEGQEYLIVREDEILGVLE